MSSANGTKKSTSNDLLINNLSDMAQINAHKASNNSQNHTADLDLSNEIPMNLLPAGNWEIFIEILFESEDLFLEMIIKKVSL